jgi:hypothetical protein
MSKDIERALCLLIINVWIVLIAVGYVAGKVSNCHAF